MHPYRKLSVWSRAHQATPKIYLLTEAFPKREWYGLASQIRRAAVSVPCNIVEGSQRASKREFAFFLNIAASSAAEVSYLLELSIELGYIKAADAQELIREYTSLVAMLAALRKTLLNPR